MFVISKSDLVGREGPNHDMKDKLRNWLSPPDPWTNFNIARKTQHPGTATWFTQGDTFRQWKSTASLLWVNGLRALVIFLSFSTANRFRCLSRLRKDYHFVCLSTIILFLYLLMSLTARALSKTSKTCLGLDQPPSRYFSAISEMPASRTHAIYFHHSSSSSVINPMHSLKFSHPSIRFMVMALESPA